MSAEPALGLLVAGGAGRRFGSDKTRARLPGEELSLAAHARSILERAGLEVQVAARGRRLFDDRAPLADGPGFGPAAGLLGAAAAFPGRALVVLAVDLPMVPPALPAALAACPADLAMPAWSGDASPRREPLCALYRPRALARLAERVAAGFHDLHGLADESSLSVALWDDDRLAAFGSPADLFRNVNRPEDLAAVAALRRALPTSRAER